MHSYMKYDVKTKGATVRTPVCDFLNDKRTRESRVPLLCYGATQQFVISGGFIIGLPTVTGFAGLSVDIIAE